MITENRNIKETKYLKISKIYQDIIKKIDMFRKKKRIVFNWGAYNSKVYIHYYIVFIWTILYDTLLRDQTSLLISAIVFY